MPLIYVCNGYSNMGWGHRLPLYMHVLIWEQPSIPRKSYERRKNFIILLALFDSSQSVSSNCPPKWRWTMGVNHGLGWHGVGWVLHHLPKKQIWSNKEKSLKLYISVFSNCSNKIGVEHGPEYQGKGVGEGVYAPWTYKCIKYEMSKLLAMWYYWVTVNDEN